MGARRIEPRAVALVPPTVAVAVRARVGEAAGSPAGGERSAPATFGSRDGRG